MALPAAAGRAALGPGAAALSPARPFLGCERGCGFGAATMLVLGVMWKLLILYKATQ